MPRYDVRNDGVGPYAVFYCEKCDREFRSSPDVAGTIAQDLGKNIMGGFLRNVPLVGGVAADNLVGKDPRYTYSLTAQELEKHWKQVADRFHECPTCKLLVCPSDYDPQTGYCNDDTPRRNEIARAQAEQAGNVFKGLADAFGVGDAMQAAGQAAKQASASLARCPKDGTVAPAGTKFCPECGSPMTQPAVATCPSCGTPTAGAKFCPNCGAKVQAAAPVATNCSKCGAELNGAKFCPECGTKAG
jgi:hypothetical protein